MVVFISLVFSILLGDTIYSIVVLIANGSVIHVSVVLFKQN